MTRTIFCLICIFVGITLSFSVQAQGTDLTKNFGIGLQGATPTFGGISFRYTGLVYLHLYIFKPLDVLSSAIKIATTC